MLARAGGPASCFPSPTALGGWGTPAVPLTSVTSFHEVEGRKLRDIVIEQRINEFFGDAESTGFGTGWWSGILSVFFGFLAFGGVLCLHFPQFLTSAEFRPFYSLSAIRLLIQGLIVTSVLFGFVSSIVCQTAT